MMAVEREQNSNAVSRVSDDGRTGTMHQKLPTSRISQWLLSFMSSIASWMSGVKAVRGSKRAHPTMNVVAEAIDEGLRIGTGRWSTAIDNNVVRTIAEGRNAD